MTTLYRPVLIETTEQAEALPEGTVAFAHTPLRGDCYTKYDFDNWEGARRGLGSPDASMVGWTALVPIEAEEETMWEDSAYFRTQTRLATPWEHA